MCNILDGLVCNLAKKDKGGGREASPQRQTRQTQLACILHFVSDLLLVLLLLASCFDWVFLGLLWVKEGERGVCEDKGRARGGFLCVYDEVVIFYVWVNLPCGC